jgi:hypothetical protein
MNVCDVCNANLESPDGYLLTTRQIVSNPAYWKKAFSRLGELSSLGADLQMLKGGLAEQQAKMIKPWLVCADCAGLLGQATSEAREYARLWWSTGETFVPPGSGPVPLSEVRFTQPSAEILASGVPRPTRALFFGRGFVPGESEVRNAIQGMVMSKGKLTSGHLMDIPVECESRPAVSREAFFKVVDEVRRWNPSAFILDILALDQRTGRDTAMLAIWEGAAAEKARPHFPADASPKAFGTSVERGRGAAADKAERLPPKKWTRVLGVVLIVWGSIMVLSGISLMPRPGATVSRPPVTDQPRAGRQLTPEEAASVPMGMGTVLAGIGIWLKVRRRQKKGVSQASAR